MASSAALSLPATTPAKASLLPVLSSAQMWVAGLILALSNFMVVLDLTIANVSVPHIAGNLGITLDQGTWIITSYAVAEAVCVPLTGWLAQRFGVVRVFIVSMLGFGLFSLLCGLSMGLGMLVACRIGQGVCGGPLMPMSQTLLARVFPPEKQGMALGLWAMTTLLGPALGPILGGSISDSFNWHWIFLINVPIALICGLGAFALLKRFETETTKLPIDRVGLGLLLFWIGCLQVMLDLGRDRDWFADPMIAGLGGLAAIGFVVFLIWELTEEHPVVNLRVFRHRGYSWSVFTFSLSFGAYFASIVVVPQWLQVSMGYSATQAGIVTAFTAFSALATAPIAAKLMEKVDPRLLISSALAWLGLMSILRAQWTTGADFWTLSIPQVLQGLAMPFMMIPLTQASLRSVGKDETASAAGLQNFLRTMAVAVATSLVLTAWSNAQRVSTSELAGSLHPGETQATLANLGMSAAQSPQIIANLVDQQAMMSALNQTSLISTAILLFSACVIWLAPRPTGPAVADTH